MTAAVVLGSIADVFNGKTPAKAEQRDSGHPVLKIKDVDDDGRFRGPFESFVDADFAQAFAERMVRAGDTLILNAAHNAEYVGSKYFFADRQVAGALTTGEWLVVRPRTEAADSRYIHYWLRSAEARRGIRSAVKGIHLYPKDVAQFELPLPQLPEQRRIADILDRADAVRRKRKESIALTEQLLRSAFLEMFGDPVTNPRGWHLVPVGDVVSEIKDGPHVSPQYSERGVPILSTRNVRPGRLVLDDMKYLDERTFEEVTRKFRPQRGDVLLTKGGTTGYAKAVDFDWPFAVWVHLAVLRPRESVRAGYLEAALNSDYCYRQSQHHTRGIANRDLGLTRIVKIRLPLPPLSAQDKFLRFCDGAVGLRRRLEQAFELDDVMFDALGQRAFRGELTGAGGKRQLGLFGEGARDVRT